jgi:hypothetical protein
MTVNYLREAFVDYIKQKLPQLYDHSTVHGHVFFQIAMDLGTVEYRLIYDEDAIYLYTDSQQVIIELANPDCLDLIVQTIKSMMDHDGLRFKILPKRGSV